MDHDVEEEPDLPEPRHEHLRGGEVAVGGDRDELGEPLDDAEDDRVEPAHETTKLPRAGSDAAARPFRRRPARSPGAGRARGGTRAWRRSRSPRGATPCPPAPRREARARTARAARVTSPARTPRPAATPRETTSTSSPRTSSTTNPSSAEAAPLAHDLRVDELGPVVQVDGAAVHGAAAPRARAPPDEHDPVAVVDEVDAVGGDALGDRDVARRGEHAAVAVHRDDAARPHEPDPLRDLVAVRVPRDVDRRRALADDARAAPHEMVDHAIHGPLVAREWCARRGARGLRRTSARSACSSRASR